MRRYRGLAAAPGIAIGPAWVYRPVAIIIDRRSTAEPGVEWERVENAFAMARMQLQALEDRARRMVGGGEADIFVAH